MRRQDNAVLDTTLCCTTSADTFKLQSLWLVVCGRAVLRFSRINRLVE